MTHIPCGQPPTPVWHGMECGPFADDRTRDFVLCEEATAEAMPAAVAPQAQRYQASELHAEGGLGQVYRAHDQELHRLVALKRLPERYCRHPELRKRFRREAEITAGLEHPGIVPVYGMVTDEAGRPAYAMRFIEGETLHHAVSRYYAASADPMHPLGQEAIRQAEFRRLLHRFIDVCNTVAYAHSRGVIHRDIKPQNIMLGPFAETLLLDWGLAKRYTMSGGEARDTLVTRAADTSRIQWFSGDLDTSDTSEVDALVPAPEVEAEAEAPLTQQGQAVGTPQYMSPEQAVGNTDLGPASDIYNLGATLYFLLTGAPPLSATHWSVAREAIRTGAITPPGQRRARVPPPLEAICLKAMALDPRNRYASSLDLASDIEKWLAHEPVTAWREPWTLRVRRWVGRHRRLVSSAIMLLFSIVVALVAALVAVQAEKQQTVRAHRALLREEQRTRAALAESQRLLQREAWHRQQTRTSLDAAMKLLIDDYFTQQAKLTGEHRQFLENLLGCYQAFATHADDEFQVRVNAASVAHRVANIHKRLGHEREAESAFRLAQQQYRQLLAEEPLAPCCRYMLGLITDQYGMFLVTQGRWSEAEEAHRESVGLFRGLVADYKGQPFHQQLLACALHNLGLVLDRSQRFTEADALFHEAGTIRNGLATRFPRSLNYQHLLAAHYVNLGKLHGNRRQFAEAERQAQLALPLFEKLVKAQTQQQSLYFGLAVCLADLGRYRLHLDRWQEADEALLYAMKVQELLYTRHPSDVDYALHLGTIYVNLAVLRRQNGRPGDALHLTTVAEQVLQPFRDREARATDLKKILGAIFLERAAAHLALEAPDEAVSILHRAMPLAGEADRADYQALLSRTLARLGQYDEAQDIVTELLRQGGLSGTAYYSLACTQAQRAARLPSFVHWHRELASQAVDLLHQAEQQEYFATALSRAQLRAEPNFAGLRENSQFQQWCQRVLGNDNTVAPKQATGVAPQRAVWQRLSFWY